jgi:SOS-response transcriptional repressor LexA
MVDIKNTFSDRLRVLKDKHNYSLAKIADGVGVSAQAVHKWLAGGNIDDDKLVELAAFFGVSPSFLKFGDAPVLEKALGLEPSSMGAKPSNVGIGPDNKGDVPIVSWVTAGNWCAVADPYEPGIAEEWLPCPKRHGPKCFGLRVRGISMENPGGKHTYSDGDVIYVDPDKQAENGSRVVVRLDDDKEATFKQLVIEGEHRYLRALNPSWPQKIIEVNGNATICGVVIGKWIDE